jgi:toxin ParE1/3/4
VRFILWTHQARTDLAAILAFISQDSPHYASLVVSRIIAATDRLIPFPNSGRAVPEVDDRLIREVAHPPYRVVYRLVGRDQIHILTVHHSSKSFPTEL